MVRLTVKSVEKAGEGRHGDGDGLYLVVKPATRLSPAGSRSWILRVQQDGLRRDIGLGKAVTTVAIADQDVPLLHRRVLSLADARKKASILRELAKAGRDPVAERDRDRGGVPTFEVAARSAHEALKSNWVEKNASAFLTSLETHAFPSLGRLRVDRIEASHVSEMLQPIWTKIPETARKVRMRVGMVLNFAHAKGWRALEAPGRSISMALPKQASGGNYAAMPFDDVPGFIKLARARSETVGRLALLFTIYTAARSGEVRSARWGDINLDRRIWIRPATHMKSREAHIVTLNGAAISILEKISIEGAPASDALIFPGAKAKPLSDMTLTKVLRDIGVPYTVHGFRSSFRDWAAERMPGIPDAVAEAALAHAVPDKVERAYKRTTFLEMRRELLDAWGTFCERV